MNGVTAQQLEQAMADIRSSLRAGFEALNDRLDSTNSYLKELNGRTRKAEDSIARYDERIKYLEHARRRRRDDPGDDDHRGERAEPDGDNRRITQRDIRLVGLGAGAILAVLKGLPWVVGVAKAFVTIGP